MELVNVLISTYNGEKYIREQIDSILNQSYKKIAIYVRDDGSTDGTLKILEQYESKHQITLFHGENMGFGKSFLWLLKYTEQGDYWAFCDQDDIWERDKIQHAVDKLQDMCDNEPNMYVHDFWITDEMLNPQYKYGNNIPEYSFQMAITECLHMGFAIVFNKNFRRLMLKGDIEKLPSHDWWAELIAMEFGNIFVDEYIGAKHRRLDSSVSGNSLINRIKWFGRALEGDSEIPGLAREFQKTFDGDVREEDRKVIGLFVTEHYDFVKALKKTFYPKRWRSNMVSELVVRCLMLIGKI